MKPTQNIFISYAKEDFDQYVIPIISIFDNYCLTYWLDVDEINVGDKVFQILEEKILDSDNYIVFFSNNYIKKHWCLYELGLITKKIDVSKNIILVACGIDSKKLIKETPSIRDYAFEELSISFTLSDAQKLTHRIIRTVFFKRRNKLFLDFKFVVEQIENKSIRNKDIIIYFLHLLTDLKKANKKESIFIINNITDLILNDIMQKHNYDKNKSAFISIERFPQSIITSLSIIENSKSLSLTDSSFSRLLCKNCFHAFSLLLEWCLS